MIYSNDDPMAIVAMEIERTANYGDYGYDDTDNIRCPVCGVDAPEFYYLNDDEECIGCTECIYKTDVLF